MGTADAVDVVMVECSNCEVELAEALGQGVFTRRQLYSCMPCRELIVRSNHPSVRSNHDPEDDSVDCGQCGDAMLALWPPPPGKQVLGRCPVCRAGELTLIPVLASG